jgi:hypothetical protein
LTQFSAITGADNQIFVSRGDGTGAWEDNAAAASDTGKVSKTGDTMSGNLVIKANLISSNIDVGPIMTNATTGIAIGKGAYVTIADLEDGIAIGRMANGSDGVAIGNSATGSVGGSAVGLYAKAENGVAVGYEANGYWGTALGASANGAKDGVGIGLSANGYQNGFAVNKQAKAAYYGIAIGRASDGSYSNIAIGLGANAHPSNECIRRIAIGTAVSNDVGDDTIMVRGNLYLDGGSHFYYRPSFQSGAWSLFAPSNVVALTDYSSADSTTNYVKKTGDTMSGSITSVVITASKTGGEIQLHPTGRGSSYAGIYVESQVAGSAVPAILQFSSYNAFTKTNTVVIGMGSDGGFIIGLTNDIAVYDDLCGLKITKTSIGSQIPFDGTFRSFTNSHNLFYGTSHFLDPDTNTWVVISATGGVKVGVSSFFIKPTGDVSQDSTNIATLGIVTGASFQAGAFHSTNVLSKLGDTATGEIKGPNGSSTNSYIIFDQLNGVGAGATNEARAVGAGATSLVTAAKADMSNQFVHASAYTNILPVASWSFLSAKTDATGEWKTVWSPKWYGHAIPLVEVGYWCDAGTATVELLSRDLAGVFTTLNVVNVNCATYSNVAAGGSLAVSNMLGLRVQDGVSATSLYFGVSGWLP